MQCCSRAPSQTGPAVNHIAFRKSQHCSTGNFKESPRLMVLSGHSNRYEPSSSSRKRPTSVLSGPLVLTLIGRCCCGSASLLALLAGAKVLASDFRGFPAIKAGPDCIISGVGHDDGLPVLNLPRGAGGCSTHP